MPIRPPLLVRVPMLFTFMALTFLLHAGESEYKPELFENTKLVYADTFEGPLNTEFWEVRQNTTWTIVDGVLVGTPSSKEFQAKKKASGDPSHAGLKPVIWLKKVPENFVCTMRLKYVAQAYQKGFPLLDVGHHIHTITFHEKGTTLVIKKSVESIFNEEPLFRLNQWHTIAIELKKSSLVFSVDGVKACFKSANIDMTGQNQIDFKGVDFGTCEIDDLKLWEGL